MILPAKQITILTYAQHTLRAGGLVNDPSEYVRRDAAGEIAISDDVVVHTGTAEDLRKLASEIVGYQVHGSGDAYRRHMYETVLEALSAGEDHSWAAKAIEV